LLRAERDDVRVNVFRLRLAVVELHAVGRIALLEFEQPLHRVDTSPQLRSLRRRGIEVARHMALDADHHVADRPSSRRAACDRVLRLPEHLRRDGAIRAGWGHAAG
jgi:hypothetical protein